MWINGETSVIYKFHSDIRAAFPNISMPDILTDLTLADLGIFPVQQTTVPEYNPITSEVSELPPALVNNIWQQVWEIIALPQSQVIENQNRARQQLINTVVSKTQERLDNFAKSRNYDGILSACSYSNSTILKFKTEGTYCLTQRDNTWMVLYQILDQVENGTRPIPSSFEDIEPELPILEWPNS